MESAADLSHGHRNVIPSRTRAFAFRPNLSFGGSVHGPNLALEDGGGDLLYLFATEATLLIWLT